MGVQFLFDGAADALTTVLLAHGAGAPMDSASMNATAKALAGSGLRVARFEFGYMAAIVREPDVFLFDEPLSNLDAGLRTRTRVELAQLHERLGATMIFVTHDQVEAMTLADRIVLFHDKKIVQVATPGEIYARPATRYVAQFIGSPGMNFVKIVSAGERSGFLTAKLVDGSDVTTAVPAADVRGPDLTLGIRPEYLVVARDKKGVLKAEVETIERLGDRSLVHAVLADGSKVIGADPGMTNLAHGDAVVFDVNSSQLTVFDQTGQAYHAADRARH